MALKPGVDLPERGEILLVDDPLLCQLRVEGGRGVPLGQHHAGPFFLAKIHFQLVDSRKQVDHGERPAHMAHAGLVYHLHNPFAVAVRRQFQLLYVRHNFMFLHYHLPRAFPIKLKKIPIRLKSVSGKLVPFKPTLCMIG